MTEESTLYRWLGYQLDALHRANLNLIAMHETQIMKLPKSFVTSPSPSRISEFFLRLLRSKMLAFAVAFLKRDWLNLN